MAYPEFSSTSRSDLLEIWAYIARDDVVSADRFLDELRDLCWRLADAPGMGRSRAELGTEARSFRHGKSIIFYRATDFGIYVIRIVHGARKLQSLLRGH